MWPPTDFFFKEKIKESNFCILRVSLKEKKRDNFCLNIYIRDKERVSDSVCNKKP